MDGDEQGSCGTAVCDAGTADGAGDEAVASGDAAPLSVDGESTSRESAEDVTVSDAAADTAHEQDGSAPDAEDDGPAADDATDEAEAVEPEGVEVAAPTDPALDAEPVMRTRRLPPYLRRGALALVAAGFVAVGVGAFAWIAPSPEAVNRRFVEAAESKGHVVAPGEQESLVVSAARKICDRRVVHETGRDRRATALTSDEIAAVGAAFGAETRDFTTLALKTYCGS